MPTINCCTCAKKLSWPEKSRYYEELDTWAAKNPHMSAHTDLRCEQDPSYTGVKYDCDKCAVDRLKIEKQMANAPFMDKVAAGGAEGFWLAAFVIMGMVTFLAVAAK